MPNYWGLGAFRAWFMLQLGFQFTLAFVKAGSPTSVLKTKELKEKSPQMTLRSAESLQEKGKYRT